MITSELKAKIYELQQEDRWEFLHETNGYTWLRTANNNEVVGMSHTTFLTQEDCKQNARMVGYENMFNNAQFVTWETYQDSKGDYRWRALNQDGQVINRSHAPYKSEFAAEKNAIRHGYLLTEQVGNDSGKNSGLFCCAAKAKPLSRTALLACIVFIAAASFLGMSHKKEVQHTIAMNILDLPTNEAEARCVQKLAQMDVIPLFINEKQPEGSFTYIKEVATLEDVATMIGSFTNSVSKNSQPEAYNQYAMDNNWREFTLPIEDYKGTIATKGSIARSIIDALKLNETDSVSQGILKNFGSFDPTSLASKLDIALQLCALPESK